MRLSPFSSPALNSPTSPLPFHVNLGDDEISARGELFGPACANPLFDDLFPKIESLNERFNLDDDRRETAAIPVYERNMFGKDLDIVCIPDNFDRLPAMCDVSCFPKIVIRPGQLHVVK